MALRYCINLSMLYTEHPFLDRFDKAARAGFSAVECLFPYDFDLTEIKARLEHLVSSRSYSTCTQETRRLANGALSVIRKGVPIFAGALPRPSKLRGFSTVKEFR